MYSIVVISCCYMYVPPLQSSHTTAEAVSITLNPSGFSPSQCDTAVFYEAGESEVPTAQLLSFNDQPGLSPSPNLYKVQSVYNNNVHVAS